MTISASPRLQTYAALAAVALVAALAAGSPELAVLATPFLLLVAVGLAGAAPALDGGCDSSANVPSKGSTSARR